MKEEQILFPYIARMEHSVSAGEAAPAAIFGSVDNPVRMMMQEHEAAGVLMARIRTITGIYTPPEDACPSFRGLYAGLQDFEKDLHRHVHLENNVLFPRAIKMEEENGGSDRMTMAAGRGCGCHGEMQ
jgi:regulator of cell morphogenesis and NO signaling